VLLTAARLDPDNPALHGAMALNFSSPTTDIAAMARLFLRVNASPVGSNSRAMEDEQFEAAIWTRPPTQR